MRFRLLAPVLLLTLATPLPRAQTAPGPVYAIAGTVVDAVSGQPLSRAALWTEDVNSNASRYTQTDEQGRFRIDAMPTGKFRLLANKRGYIGSYFESHENYHSAIVTGPGQASEDLVFRLNPEGAIYGNVSGEGGEAVEEGRVYLFRVESEPGFGQPRPRLFKTATTDDAGNYEFAQLRPGQYRVAVMAEPWFAVHPGIRPGQDAPPLNTPLDVAYPVTYYDSVRSEGSATHLRLDAGSRIPANFNLQAVQALHIALPSKATDTPGRFPPAFLVPTLLGAELSAAPPVSFTADGIHTYLVAAPGNYTLTYGDPPRIVQVSAETDLDIEASAGTPAATLNVKLVDATGAPLTGAIKLLLTPDAKADNLTPIYAQSEQGAIQFPTLAPGQWQMALYEENGYRGIVSHTMGGKTTSGNLLAVPAGESALTITAASAQVAVEGFVRRAGKGVAGVMVLLVPDDLAHHRDLIRRDQSDSDGSFQLRDTAPGRYTVVALENGWDLSWARPEVLAPFLAHGLPLTVPATSPERIRITSELNPQPAQP